MGRQMWHYLEQVFIDDFLAHGSPSQELCQPSRVEVRAFIRDHLDRGHEAAHDEIRRPLSHLLQACSHDSLAPFTISISGPQVKSTPVTKSQGAAASRIVPTATDGARSICRSLAASPPSQTQPQPPQQLPTTQRCQPPFAEKGGWHLLGPKGGWHLLGFDGISFLSWGGARRSCRLGYAATAACGKIGPRGRRPATISGPIRRRHPNPPRSPSFRSTYA